MARLPNDIEFRPEEGGVVLNLDDAGEKADYSAVELVAMVLSSAQVCWWWWVAVVILVVADDGGGDGCNGGACCS